MKLNILLVDDSLTMRAMLRKIILISGLPVARFFEAANGQEGLNLLESQWIDLVLVDLNMPVMGGMELIDRIRRKQDLADLPVIVVSTESSQTRIAELDNRHVYFLHKPFTPEQVRAIVQRYWELSATRLTEQMLIQVAQEVFESLMCMSLQCAPAAADQEKYQYRAVIRFAGPFAGTLALDAPGRLMPAIYQNMLGEETPSTPEQQLDALGELTNVICGNLLARLAGPEPIFNLDAPRTLLAPDGRAPAPPQSRQTLIRMAVDEAWIELTLTVEADNSASPVDQTRTTREAGAGAA